MEKVELKEYILSNNKKVILAIDVKEKIDTYNFNQLIDMRVMYSYLPFGILDNKIYIDTEVLKNMTDLISYIDDKLINYQSFYNYLYNINLDFQREKEIYGKSNEFLYTNKLYYETLRDNISCDFFKNDCCKK